MKKIRLGILGASTLLANELLLWLEKWHFPCDHIVLLDTIEHCGYVKQWSGSFLSIQRVNKKNLELLDLLFICDDALWELHHNTIKDSCYCLNLGSYHVEEHIVLPQINLEKAIKEEYFYYIPNASLFVLAHILRVVSNISIITHVSVNTAQSVSEVGIVGRQELRNQVDSYVHKKDMEATIFPTSDSFQHLPLLFQSLPQTTKFLENGSTEEEDFLSVGLSYLLDDVPPIGATCTRVPCIRGISMSVVLQLQEEHPVEELMDAFSTSSSFICIDDTRHEMYPIIADVLHDYRVFMGRMRSNRQGDFMAWAVCDDLSSRCAAAVQCALYFYHNFF